MGWMETCAVDERTRFVIAAEKREEPLAALCREFGVSRKTGYEWLGRRPCVPPARRFSCPPGKASGNARLLPQPVARRRLGAVGTVQVQSSRKLPTSAWRPTFSFRSASFSRERPRSRPQDLVLGPQRLVCAT